MTVGELMLLSHQPQFDKLQEKLVCARDRIATSLVATTMEGSAYTRAYKYVTRLHMIGELEQAMQCFHPDLYSSPDYNMAELPSPILDPKALLHLWKSRHQFFQVSTKSLEPMLEFRRFLLSLDTSANPLFQEEIGRLWLQSARLARRAGHFQSAWGFLVSAMKFNLPETFVEEAKQCRLKNQLELAITTLQNGIQKHFCSIDNYKADKSPASKFVRSSFAKAQILLANYSQEASATDHKRITEMYQRACEIYPEWESGMYHLAKYFDTYIISQVKTCRIALVGTVIFFLIVALMLFCNI